MDTRPTVNGRRADPDVEAELQQLGTMPVVALRGRYRELFRSEPPPAFGPDLLRRSIAQCIQEKAYGGLSRETKKLLNQLIRSMASGKAGRLELPQRIKPGSDLVRTWNGQTHKVTVMAKGFAYQARSSPAYRRLPTGSPAPAGTARSSLGFGPRQKRPPKRSR